MGIRCQIAIICVLNNGVKLFRPTPYNSGELLNHTKYKAYMLTKAYKFQSQCVNLKRQACSVLLIGMLDGRNRLVTVEKIMYSA